MKIEIFRIFAPMNEEKRISVVINTRNAAQYLQEVIDAVQGFDEELICDMESEDETLDIARRKSRELFCSSRNYSYLCGVNLKLNDYEITNRMVAMYVADGALGAGGAGVE